MIHLDTSFLVDLLREQRRETSGPATAWLAGHADLGVAVSVFVACELEAGAAQASHPQRERGRVRAVLAAVEIVFPDERFAVEYAAILSQVRSNRRTIATMDLLIATAARADDASLLTANTRHFGVVPDLRLTTYR